MIQSKQAIRKKLRSMRDRLTPNQVKTASQIIINKLKQIPEFQQANSFFIYVDANNEVQTRDLITELLKQKKEIAVPKMITQEDKKIMIPVQIHNLSELKPRSFGILEPTSSKKYSKKIDVAVVPGVAFTAEGDRLGMGGGNYDRFISENPDTFTIGLAYYFQIVDSLPMEEEDKRVDLVLTT